MFGLDDLLAIYGAGGPSSMEAVRLSVNLTDRVVFSGVSTDSRQCSEGSLFVALPGERHDGHDYIEDALFHGCRAVLASSIRLPPGQRRQLVSRVCEWDGQSWTCSGPESASSFLVLVPDSLEGLQRLAARWRTRFSPIVVGITGSVGKSSTKELTAAVLSQRFDVLKNPKSYNNEIGLPLTLLQLNPQHRVVVLEMGTYGPGEITLLTDIARPQLGIVTNVSHSHLERMKTLGAIAQAKSELPAALPPDGLAVLNGDEELIREMSRVTSARVLYYGLARDCDVRAEQVYTHGFEGISFDLHWGQERRRLRCAVPGRHSVYNALAATAVGRYLGMSWDEIEAGLLDPSARLRLLVVPGQHGSMLLDDTYNASPLSCRVALDLLAELPGRRLAVFGDMLELGSFEEEGHRLVGRWASALVEEMFLLGTRARWIGEAALAQGMPPERVYFADAPGVLVELLQERLAPDVIVLVKGSRGMEMDRIVAALRREEA